MIVTKDRRNYRQFVQDKSMTKEPLFNISGVERDTGFSKDVLRMWERRYGFPKPARDDNGERQYTSADVGKLRAMKEAQNILRAG